MVQEYPPDLSEQEANFLLSSIKGWCFLNGLAVRPSKNFVPEDVDPSGSLAVAAPVTLFPSPFPRSCFQEARTIQAAYNQLYAAIASDEKWLAAIVEELVEVDDFIKSLWEVHLAVKREGYVQDIALGIFRSDYMNHQNPSVVEANDELRQVEFNTIASSFGGLAARVSALHRYLVSIDAYPINCRDLLSPDSLPVNPSIDSISRGLSLSHKAYGSSKSQVDLPRCVLFVVQDPENNIFDQLAISTHLLAAYEVQSFRLPFQDTLQHTWVEEGNPSRPLIYTPPHRPGTRYEVTTLYFRAGYSPAEYSKPSAWEARRHLERSAAIKCPSILTHLAGSKKIQQILATPSSPYLEYFLAKTAYSQYIDRIRATFAAIYPLDHSDAGQEAIKIATDAEKAQKYVLKPQREGGGNNIYGADIPPFMKSLGDVRNYRGHILMELIEPPSVKNSIVRNGEVRSGEVIGELGIFGVCIWRNQQTERGDAEVLENFEAGFLLRTKGRESQEGGVAAGFGCVDSVLLVSDKP